MHPICMECSLRIRVFGEKKQCPQCQTDIPIVFFYYLFCVILLLNSVF
ncbi:unnamed protein product [Meloidogyne enterolobii]|uniref:Uncharacterized protein n=1 Tax=Meloidogyne enterolobii TaxID=390850 RepID=A0ACB1AYC2_MELEN